MKKIIKKAVTRDLEKELDTYIQLFFHPSTVMYLCLPDISYLYGFFVLPFLVETRIKIIKRFLFFLL